jgi:hypothetical protein
MSLLMRLLNALAAFFAAPSGATPLPVVAPPAEPPPTAAPTQPSGITWGKVAAFVRTLAVVDVKKIETVLTAGTPAERMKDALVVGEDALAILGAVGIAIPGAGEIEAAAEVLVWLTSSGLLHGADPTLSAAEGGFPDQPTGGKTGRR